MSKLDEIAESLYNAHVRFAKKEADLDSVEWKKLPKKTKDYWRGLVLLTITELTVLNQDMVDVVLDNMRKPIIISDGATWEEVRTAQFGKWWALALDAASYGK